jgi:beta-lactamase regulating signal transducer with metallopeptidase domain
MEILQPALLPGWAAEIGVILLVKGSLLLAAAWMLARVCRGGTAATRCAVWTAGLAALLALPVIPLVAPGTNLGWVDSSLVALGVPRALATTARAIAPTTSVVASPSGGEAVRGLAGPAQVLLAVWALGALLLVARLSLDWGRILRITARATAGVTCRELTRRATVMARRQGVTRQVRVVVSDEMRIPVTWGIWRPVVLLPRDARDWSRSQLDAVLLHELAHVQRWDYPKHLLSELARALYWPNPLAWLAISRARMERERACDDTALRLGATSADYARLLLQLARVLAGARVARGAMALARSSILSTRIDGVLDPGLDRRPAAPAHVFLSVAFLVAVSVPVGTVRVWASPPRTPADWVAIMDRPEPEVRLAAVSVLEAHGSGDGVAALSRALTDEDPIVRRTAARALGRVGDARAVPALVGVVTGSHGDLHQKRIATEALRAIDERAASEALAAQLSHHGPGTRALTPVVGAVASPDPSVWEPVVRILSEDPDPEARSLAAAVLVELGCDAAIPALLEATQDANAVVRLAAVNALAAFDTWPVKRAMARLADEDPDAEVRQAASAALECDDGRVAIWK